MWKTFVGAVIGVAAAIIAGPAGFALVQSAWAIGAVGGAVAGAVTGGLNGGWKGALMGGLIGGATGAFGGWGVGEFGKGFAIGLLGVGAGASYATGGLEGLAHFGAGLAGGALGSFLGNSFVGSQHFQNLKAGNGFRSNRSVTISEYKAKIEALRALNVNQKNATVERISRPLGGRNGPGSTTGPHHNALVSKDFQNGVWEMGPDASGTIQTTNTVGDLQNWGTAQTTQQSLGLGGDYIESFQVGVNRQGLMQAINLYEQTFAGNVNYNALNHNSNFAVNSVIYAAGGDIPSGGRAPGFPTKP